MRTDDVLAFLDSHPDFLQHHAKRLGLNTKFNDQSVISFSERQILGLNEKIRHLEAKLSELTYHGKNSYQIQVRVHQLSMALLRIKHFDMLIHTLNTFFATEFGLERIALRLWHNAAEKYHSYFTSNPRIHSVADRLTSPSCGPYVNDEIMNWFPTVPVLQSFALLALHDDTGQPFGLLVLASDDPKRFTHDMHTYYLEQIAQLIASALLRILT